jgi:hypothetical protein
MKNKNNFTQKAKGSLGEGVVIPQKKSLTQLANGYYIRKVIGGDFRLYRSERAYLYEFKDFEIFQKRGGDILVFFEGDKLIVFNPQLDDERIFVSAKEYKDIPTTSFVVIKDIFGLFIFLNTDTMKASRAFSLSGYSVAKDGKGLLLKRKWFHLLRPFVLLSKNGRFSKPFHSYLYGEKQSVFLLAKRNGRIFGTFMSQ